MERTAGSSMAAGGQPEIIVEEREELMVPLSDDGRPTQRSAHFLRPSLGFPISQHRAPKPLPLSHHLAHHEPGERPLKQQLVFTGWVDPHSKWNTWVHQMHSLHQSTWKKAGICEAVMSSTYKTRRNYELFWGLAERWCPSINSFVFPWGEATITLEDIMVLGGFSVVGEPVHKPLETTDELIMKMEEKIMNLRAEAEKGSKPFHREWVNRSIGKGGELEHVAFLVLWLSRYVFFTSKNYSIMGRNLFCVAIHLSRGIRLALGPAVLASIYIDLSLLSETINIPTKDQSWMHGDEDNASSLTLRAPLRLVQVWAWERFPGLRPDPNPVNLGEPRIARWLERPKSMKIGRVRMALDSAQDTFQWRPYVTAVRNCPLPKFYIEEEKWMVVDSDSDQELQSFAQCLRVCELVGIDNCIELYLPHRVAMQFGIDQDIPCNVTHESHQSKPIWDSLLYVPSRLFEADVTAQYLAWWRQSSLSSQAAFMGVTRRRRGLRRPRKSLQCLSIKKVIDIDDKIPSCFPPKCNLAYPNTTQSYLLSPKEEKGDDDADVPPGFPPKCNMPAAPKTAESYLISPKEEKGDDDADAPPGLTPKCNLAKTTEGYLISPKEEKGDYDAEVPLGFPPKCNMLAAPNTTTESYVISPKEDKGEGDAEVPPGFPPKCNLTYPNTSESYLISPKEEKGDDDAEVSPGFPPGFEHRCYIMQLINRYRKD